MLTLISSLVTKMASNVTMLQWNQASVRISSGREQVVVRPIDCDEEAATHVWLAAKPSSEPASGGGEGGGATPTNWSIFSMRENKC